MTVRLGFVGDVMLGRLVSERLPEMTAEAPWGDVLPVLQDMDAVFANLECAVTTSTTPWARTPKVFHFGAIPKAVDVLKAGNIHCVALANNHILDFEVAGLEDTLAYLDAAGIARAGAGMNLAEARRPAWLTVGDLGIAFASLTDNEPAFAADADRPGVYWCSAHPDDPAAPRAAEIADWRKEGAGLIILSAHLGPNMVTRPAPGIRDFKTRMFEAGIDLLHGHSAHVFQGIERVEQGLILHDCGDFLDDYAVDPELHNDWSFLYCVEIDDHGRPVRLELTPVTLDVAVVNRAQGHVREEINRRMIDRSRAFGVHLEEQAAGLVLDLA